MNSSRGLKKMASTDCSFEPMEVDLRAADMSIRPMRHSLANNIDGTMDLSTRRRNRNSDSSLVQNQPADLSGSRRNSMDTLPSSDQRSRDRPQNNNNNSVPLRSRPNSVGGIRYSADISNHRRPARSSNSGSAITQMSLVSDIIVLSDEEAPRINGHVNGFSTDSHPDSPNSDMPDLVTPTSNRAQHSKVELLTPEERVKRELTLRRLQEELRNEEMKLVLLKKLRQSQLVKEPLITPTPAVQTGTVASSQPGKMTGMVNRTSSPQHQQNSSISVSNNLLRSSSGKLNSHQSQSLLVQPLNQSQSQSIGNNSRSGSSSSLPPGIMLQQNMLRNSGLLGRASVTTPPNVVMGYPMQSSQGSKSSVPQNSSSSVQASSTSSPTPPQISGQLAQVERVETQTPAQRQAAAKLALRKQLEKTLLQIPPPKPPPPEMHFIPNANNQEFVYLVGLEVVVGFIVGDEHCNKPPPDPFDCVQCATDFTPVWKWQDAGEKKKPPAVICESCVTTNIKKALKAEHTNRLKTAFVKALQQEQEIEQRMSQGSTSPPLPISTPPPPVITTTSSTVPSAINHRASTPPNSHSPSPSSYNRSSGLGASSAAAANAVAAAVANSAALLQQMPKLTAAHQSLLQAQHLQQLAQSLPGGHQPQPAHMLPFGPLLAAQAYSYQMLGKSSLSSSDLQRQYLLDMIPPRSLSQNSMNWKT